ncbi:MAG: ATP-binding protein, partial [Planctomycetota bacterium]|nr:ATP-binding protein [Planctomycetota bacterium]
GISVVYVRKLFQGREGRVYAGTTNGVIVFDGDQVQNWANPEDPGANNVFAMLDSPAGAIWVGTTAGLQRVTDGRLATPQPAALWMQRPTYFLVEDELGQLWCGTDDGVVCWDPASSPETARRFTVQDGLAGRETNRDAGLLATNGDVWLGTERGLSVHRRRYAAPRRPAPVLRLLPTEVSGKAHDPALPLEVRSTNHTLTFRFRATYLADEARLQYRYRLFGNDLDWTGPAANSSQTVRYTNLKAGTYRFEIQARGPDTPWSPVIETADISVPTVFWVRPWFILLSILVLTGLTYGALRSLADRRSMKDLERQVAERLGEIRTLEAGIERSRQLQSLGVLAGGIAHDFNNLLTVMTGSFSLLTENHDVPEEQQAICQDGLAATARAKALTQQLLTFSRGGAPLLRPGSIGDIINESARFIMRGSDIRCVIDLPDDLWQVEMDPDQISQVISNLLLNAKQASAKGSTITIRGRNRETVNHGRIEPRSVEIEICDQGRGIPQDRIPSIFDPYFSTKEGGSGLGLATSSSIVKRHGGQLMAQSTEGHGTTMRFFIPATSAQVTDAATRPAREPANESFRVLVMDDEAQVRTVLGRMLEHLGHQPTFARDGEEALEVYAQALGEGRPIEVVLMDLTVPGGMGGQETIARLRHLDPRARAIVVSGYSNDPVLANHQDHGFCARLAKPVSIKDLAQALSRAADTPEVARPVP